MASKKEEIKRKLRLRLVGIIVVCTVLAIGALSLPVRETINLRVLEVGEPSPETYRAHRDYRLYNPAESEQAEEKQLAAIKPKFVLNHQRTSELIEAIEQQVDELRQAVGEENGERYPTGEAEWERFAEVAVLVGEYVLEDGIVKDRDVFELFEHQEQGILEVISESSENQVDSRKEIKLAEAKQSWFEAKELEERVSEVIEILFPRYPYEEKVIEYLLEILEPNVFFSRSHFDRAVSAAYERAEPVYDVIEEDELILRAGQEVTPEKYDLLRRISRADFGFHLWIMLTNLFIASLMVFLLYLFMRSFEPEFLERPKKVGLISLLVVIVVLIAKIFELLRPGLPVNFDFFFPFAAAPVLITILLSSQLAFLTVPFLALVVVTFFGLKIELLAAFIFGGIVGIFFSRDVERRTTLLRNGVIIAAVQILVAVFLYVLRTADYFSFELGGIIFWSILNGAVAVPFITIGSLPFWESGFDITTNFKLHELADLNHPLLREFFRKSPGSYQHSIILSNLCEEAAREIGASPLLTRVGAYYHDIGKAANPEYFTENQGDENPHGDLKPTLSASILKSHVKLGEEMARDADLPEVIIDFITQHQGTTLMKSFYYKALEAGEDVTEDEFRYPGPIPQFKEVAILMLGDAVEAATRSLDKPNSKKIKELVETIVYDRFKTGQLNACDLTLKDLNVIVEVFTRMLTTIHHQRVSYPDDEEIEAGKEAAADSEDGGEEQGAGEEDED